MHLLPQSHNSEPQSAYPQLAKRPRILIVASRPPFPLTKGPHIRIVNTARYLGEYYDVDLLCLNEGPLPAAARAVLADAFTEVHAFCYPPWQYRWNALRCLISPLPLQVHYYRFPAVSDWLKANLDRYHAAIANHIRTSAYLKDAPIPVLIDLHDAISLNYERALPYTRGRQRLLYRIEQPRVLRYELEVIRSFPCCFVVSEVDRQFLISNGAAANRLRVVPVGIQDSVLQRPAFSGPEQRTIAFLGNMSYHPNEDAACFFANEVLPLILSRQPDLDFQIIGADPSPRVLALARRYPRIQVLGAVAAPYMHIEQALVVVAPIRFGAGIQNKVLEAMALGKAIVTTSVAAAPIGAVHGDHVLIAEDAATFADCILSLVEAPARRSAMGARAAAYVRPRFTVAAMGSRFHQALQSLTGQLEVSQVASQK